jgi:hypothetical protein
MLRLAVAFFDESPVELQSAEKLGERLLVGAPAFMRGKERFSAPGKSCDHDLAL